MERTLNVRTHNNVYLSEEIDDKRCGGKLNGRFGANIRLYRREEPGTYIVREVKS